VILMIMKFSRFCSKIKIIKTWILNPTVRLGLLRIRMTVTQKIVMMMIRNKKRIRKNRKIL